MAILMLKRFVYDESMGHLFSLAGELKQQGADPVVILTECPPKAAEDCQNTYRGFSIFAEDRFESIIKIARRRQANIVHVHSLSLLKQAATLAGRLNVPFGATLGETGPGPASIEILEKASFVITTRQNPGPETAAVGNKVTFIPEGVNLAEFKPGEKGSFTITFIVDSGYYSDNSCLAFLKAAGLGNFFVNLISQEYYPLVNGKYHGRLADCASLLNSSDVVVGRNRALLEGMACGNAALIMGKSYHSILQPQNFGTADYPNLSGEGAGEPCYRTIFNDLSELWKDRAYLETLQYWGRKYVRENHDLRLSSEATMDLYQKALKQR